MKVLLFALNSSYVHTNPAVRCIKKAIDENVGDAETKILERTLKDRRELVLRALYDEDADIYGFSAYIWNITEMLAFASSLHLLKPGCTIVFGGPEVSFEEKDYFEAHPYIDRIIRGEGEGAWISLLKGEAEGRIIDGAPYRDFTDSGIAYTEVPQSSMIYYESSRGCPYRCAFCLSGLDEKIRMKSVAQTADDLRHIARFGDSIKVVKFVDRTFNADKERAREIWRWLIDSDYPLCCHFEICAALLEEEDFAVLSEFKKGRAQLEIGIQSTNPATLAAISRAGGTDRIISAARRIKSFGNIHVHCDLIAGLPYEDIDSFARSFDDVYGCCDMLQLGHLKLLKGSSLRGTAAEQGIIYDENPPYTVLSTPWISYEQLSDLRETAALVDRYDGGYFANTMRFIMREVRSPFAFYRSLLEELRRGYPDSAGGIQALTQAQARRLLYDCTVRGGWADNELVCEYLRFDYYLTEPRALPDYLRVYEENEDRSGFSDIIAGMAPSDRKNAELHRFIFDNDRIFVFDRKNKSYTVR